MSQPARVINRSQMTDELIAIEQQKSNLILEANLLKAQRRYQEAAARFARAADLEEQLSQQLWPANQRKAFVHEFSALSCWAEAGDVHRALTLAQQLLQNRALTSDQQAFVEDYLATLTDHHTQWMAQWAPELAAAD